MTTEKKLNASQRLDTAEVNIQELTSYLSNMARDISIMKEAIKLLGNKLDAVQRASNVTDDSVSMLMMENNANELKEKVDNFIAQGILVATEIATEQSFMVGKEVDDTGKVVNTRIQFATGALTAEVRDKLIGSKVGDLVSFTEGTLKLEVNEIYSIVTPQETPQVPSEEQQQA